MTEAVWEVASEGLTSFFHYFLFNPNINMDFVDKAWGWMTQLAATACVEKSSWSLSCCLSATGMDESQLRERLFLLQCLLCIVWVQSRSYLFIYFTFKREMPTVVHVQRESGCSFWNFSIYIAPTWMKKKLNKSGRCTNKMSHLQIKFCADM